MGILRITMLRGNAEIKNQEYQDCYRVPKTPKSLINHKLA